MKKSLSKAEEIAAFEEFVNKLGDGPNSYFSELTTKEARATVAQNIKNDFPAFIGVMVPYAEYETLKKSQKQTADQIAEMEKFDVRRINSEIRAKLNANMVAKDEIVKKELEIEGLRALLNG